MNFERIVNWFWMKYCRNDYHSFNQNLSRLKETQETILFHYLRSNESTVYGKFHEFYNIHSYTEFQERVPIIEQWQTVETLINQLAEGETNIFTKEPVFAFEETSGSTGFSKLIPYTPSLKYEFEKALNTWMYHSYLRHPFAYKGKAFWSISPALKDKRISSSGIPIGLEDDTDYLSWFSAKILPFLLASPANLNAIKSSESFYLKLLSHMLCQSNLSFCSIWSPTYFLVMDDFMRKNWEPLLERVCRKNKLRGKQLNNLNKDHFTWKDIWPELQLMSCWTNAQAALWLPLVKQKLGPVSIQGKGLMATEAVCSFPFGPEEKTILAYQSHFFEFRCHQDQSIYRAHELVENRIYELIHSTGSGLMRYASGDLVQVNGFEQEVPYLTFIGRKGVMSDLVGEKLYEHHLREALQQALSAEIGLLKGIFFIPISNLTQKPTYLLAYEPQGSAKISETQVEAVEKYLFQNPYYKQAVLAKQLMPLSAFQLQAGQSQRFINHLQELRSIKDGNLKLPLLIRDAILIETLLNPCSLSEKQL